MYKLFEKKNLGIPVKLMVLISYFIGYFITNNLNGLFAAAFVATIVFVFDFDDKVKIAIIQSYVFGLLFALLYSIFTIPEYLVNLLIPIGFMTSSDITMIQLIALAGLNILAVIIFTIYIIAALFNRDIKSKLILKLFIEKNDQRIQEDKDENIENITEKKDSIEQKITKEKDIGENNENQNKTGKLKQQKQYTKTSKLFPPSQPQYPPMPQVKPPAKIAQSSSHKTIIENILKPEPEKQQNVNITEQKPKEPEGSK
jgi:ABC-type Mn2+/Zn2+ transport systems, permease components